MIKYIYRYDKLVKFPSSVGIVSVRWFRYRFLLFFVWKKKKVYEL